MTLLGTLGLRLIIGLLRLIIGLRARDTNIGDAARAAGASIGQRSVSHNSIAVQWKRGAKKFWASSAIPIHTDETRGTAIEANVQASINPTS
jgi:hypothetical protein